MKSLALIGQELIQHGIVQLALMISCYPGIQIANKNVTSCISYFCPSMMMLHETKNNDDFDIF